MNSGMTGTIYHKPNNARVRVIINNYEPKEGFTSIYQGEIIDLEYMLDFVFTNMCEYQRIFDFLDLDGFEHIGDNIR